MYSESWQRMLTTIRRGLWTALCIISSPLWQYGRNIGRRHFQMHFPEWIWWNSDSNFTEICFQEFNSQYPIIGSGNGLAPSRRQAITWTNDGPVHWRIYVGDELIFHDSIFSWQHGTCSSLSWSLSVWIYNFWVMLWYVTNLRNQCLIKWHVDSPYKGSMMRKAFPWPQHHLN